MSRDNLETEFEKEVSERIALMENPSYEFPPALTRLDWTFIVAIPVVSLVALIIGEFRAMFQKVCNGELFSYPNL